MNRRDWSKSAVLLGLLQACGAARAMGRRPPPAPAPVAIWPQGAVAQLVGANVVSCLFDPGFGLERHLPWLLAPGPEGKAPKSFKSVAGGNGQVTPNGRFQFDESYLTDLTLSFQFVVSFYGQDVQGFNMFMWKGVRMNGLQVVGGFTAERTPEQAQEIWESAYEAYGLTSKPVLTVASGHAGWTTLEAGWRLIASPEAKVIWQATVDSPSYPKDEEPNEAAVLLMVAHPAFEAGRKPLAYFGAPFVVPHKDARRSEGETERIAALRQAAQQACTAAGLEIKSVGSLVTDCGRGTPEAAKRLSQIGAALSDIAPQWDVTKDRIDMVALLGELGANTVNYSLVLAAYAAHQRNHPVLYLSNIDEGAARAMLVYPPLDHTPPDPNRKFREHDPRGQWYAPWWGQRLDGKRDY